MPYIFDMAVEIVVPKKEEEGEGRRADLILRLTFATSLSKLLVTHFSVANGKLIGELTEVAVKMHDAEAQRKGVSHILADEKHYFAVTLDRQIKIISMRTAKEICSFSVHANAINAMLRLKADVIIDEVEEEEENEKDYSDILVTISEDCKLSLFDLNRIRKKKKKQYLSKVSKTN